MSNSDITAHHAQTTDGDSSAFDYAAMVRDLRARNAEQQQTIAELKAAAAAEAEIEVEVAAPVQRQGGAPLTKEDREEIRRLRLEAKAEREQRQEEGRRQEGGAAPPNEPAAETPTNEPAAEAAAETAAESLS